MRTEYLNFVIFFFFFPWNGNRSLYATRIKTQSLIVCTLIWASVMNLMFVYIWNFCAWRSLASLCLNGFCVLCMLATGAEVFITVLSILHSVVWTVWYSQRKNAQSKVFILQNNWKVSSIRIASLWFNYLEKSKYVMGKVCCRYSMWFTLLCKFSQLPSPSPLNIYFYSSRCIQKCM